MYCHIRGQDEQPVEERAGKGEDDDVGRDKLREGIRLTEDGEQGYYGCEANQPYSRNAEPGSFCVPQCVPDLRANRFPAGGEGAQGEEGSPEAAFGVGVGEGRGESGEPEAECAVRPGEPDALRGARERLFSEWIAEGVYGACGAGSDRHEGGWFQGEQLFEEIGVRPGDVGSVELYGGEAAPEGIGHNGLSLRGALLSDPLRNERDAGEGVAEGRGAGVGCLSSLAG